MACAAARSMNVYADSSFLVAVYSPQLDSLKALEWLQKATDSLPFTPLHRHELRTALRLRVFRRQISSRQRAQAFAEIENDLSAGILAHVPIPWTDSFREAERLALRHAEILGVRSIDLLHVGIAVALKARYFLTLDRRQLALVKAAGM